jgi:signal transduction histidine kinase
MMVLKDEILKFMSSQIYSSTLLLNQVNDLLDLAKDENNKFVINNSFFNLSKAAANSLQTLEFLASSKGITTSVEEEEEL